MATSGSFNTSGWSDATCPDYYTFSWSLSSQSIEGNYSVITWTLKGAGGSSSGYWTNVKEKYVTVNGSTQSNATLQTTYNGTVAFSGATTIYHNSDGTKSFSASAGGAFYYYGSYNSTGSGTWSLPTIPRSSTISYGEFTMGSSGNITITPAASGFTHTITYSFGTKTGTIADKTSNTSVSWTPSTSDLAGQIPNDVRGTGTLTITTYSGSTTIGSRNYTFYCNLPSSVVPTVGTITLTPQTYSYLIQGKNTVKVNVSGCSAGTGSSIKSYTFSGPGVSSTTTSTSATSSTISNTGTLTYTVSVTDNRGRTASKTATITCYAWVTPMITIDTYRVASSSSTTASDSGTYVRCTYNLTYSSVNNSNDVTVKVYYKKNTASTYSSTTILTDGTSTSGSTVLSSIDAASTYDIYATITDNYGGSSSSNHETVFSTERILNVRPNGTGIAFGKMAETDSVFDSKWPIRTDSPEQTMKNLTYKGVSIIGSTDDTTANWGNEGNLATVFYNVTGKITDQPSQYGLLLNLTNGPSSSEVHQIWATQSSGNLAHRGGNSSGWNGTWRTILDSSNYSSYITKPADYVVEETVNNDFKYRKWNSGLAELWYYKYHGDITMTTKMADGVYSNSTYAGVQVTLPSGVFLADTIPMAQGNAYSNGYTCCQVCDATSTKFSYRIWSPYSTAITACRLSVYMTGVWK